LNKLPEIRRFIREEADHYADFSVNYYGGDPRIKFVVSEDGSELNINPYQHYQQSQQGVGSEDIINVSSMNFYQVLDLMDEKGVKRKTTSPPRPVDPVTAAAKLPLPPPPAELSSLHDQCFKISKDAYIYELCLFKSVTQKQVHSTKEHGVTPYSLGRFKEYDADLKVANFGMGQSCGDKPRTTEVTFECATKQEIIDVTEPSGCAYAMRFGTPLACSPGEIPNSHAPSDKANIAAAAKGATAIPAHSEL